MCYIDIIRKTKHMRTSVMPVCRGCGCELILRTVLQAAGKNSIIEILHGCKAGSNVVFWNYFNGIKKVIHIPILHNTSFF